MVVNFKTYEINRDTCKLIRTFMLIKKKKKHIQHAHVFLRIYFSSQAKPSVNMQNKRRLSLVMSMVWPNW
jgi:hypothetical protein